MCLLKQGHTHRHTHILTTKYLSFPGVSHTHTHCKLSHHPDWPAGSHVIIMGIPALVFGVLSVLQDVLLALEIWVVVANESAALHADRVDPAHEAAVLEVIAVAADLQLPPREAFSLVQHDLCCAVSQSQRCQSNSCSRGSHRTFCRHCFVTSASAPVVLLTFPEYWDIFHSLLPIKLHSCGSEKMWTPGFIRPTGSEALSQGRAEQWRGLDVLPHGQFSLHASVLISDFGLSWWNNSRSHFVIIGFWKRWQWLPGWGGRQQTFVNLK